MNKTNAEIVEKNNDTPTIKPAQSKFLRILEAIFPNLINIILAILIFVLIHFYNAPETSLEYDIQKDTVAKILLFLFGLKFLLFGRFISKFLSLFFLIPFTFLLFSDDLSSTANTARL